MNIIEARCIVDKPMVKNRFVIEVADTQALKATVSRLRNVDTVFDAYRVIPAGGASRLAHLQLRPQRALACRPRRGR